jgi:hypothetical protein
MTDDQKEKLRAAGFNEQDIADYESEHGAAAEAAPSSSGGPVAADETVPSIAQNNAGYHGDSGLTSGGATLGAINEFLGSNLGHLVEGGGTLLSAKGLLNQYLKAKGGIPTTTAAPPASTTPSISTSMPQPVRTVPVGQAQMPAPRPIPVPQGPAAQMPAPKVPPVGGPAAQQGADFLENMATKFGALAQKYAPVINNPVTRTVGKIGGVGGQFALYHPGLNTGEAEELRRRQAMGFQPYSR